ncbi:class I SAM-dependent methyltransferase [Hymenobacter sp.]|jgi:ubiquinone/menaquinone biosynthesis C-methylase UbiE|uniref:class I SAM-dependent methyltransferase n=1 Tax=Hymenobacter sp. TaxID=1898978 RepID=UPI002ED9AEA8
MLDRFSTQAELYARYRIDYPPELYEFLLAHTLHRQRAWDCATGNGQVAVVLAEHFQHVDATDISTAQLAQAPERANIAYQVSAAEHTPLPDASLDLVTVGQAVHWFDAEAFNQEVRRVTRPGATVAEWGYGLVQVHETLNPLIQQFYAETMRPYWDANRWHIDDEYARIPFPFEAVQHTQFLVRRQWSAAWFLNYLRTWSSVVKYEKQHGQDPVQLIAEQMTQLWGPQEREVQFPVFLRLGKV